MSKKMIVMPASALEELKMHSAHPLPPTPDVQSAVRMTGDLNAILDRTDLTEEEKRTLYSQTLMRYRTVLQHAQEPRKPQPTPPVPPPTPAPPAPAPPTPAPPIPAPPTPTMPSPTMPSKTPHTDLDQTITDSIPKAMQHRGRQLLSRLKNVMSWDDKGQISYRGSPTEEGTNIIDLVGDALRPVPRKHFQPKGSKTMIRALQDINAPQD